MRDENNTPYEAEDATEVSLTQMASLEIEINQLLRDTKTNIPTKVGILINRVTKAQYEARTEIGAEISALTNMVRDRDTEIAELKARITEMEAEANEGRRIRKDLGKELSEIRAAHARLIDENAKLWKDNAELHENNKGLKETRYRLATIIDDLANVIRNS